MSIIIFLIVLSVLVIVHEKGHFIIARLCGVEVDEFGLGYPPRAKNLFTWRGTLFTLNWLPFGGFVKIRAEETSFRNKNRAIQAAVLAAGSLFNLLFAWIVLSAGLMIGLPAPEGSGLPVTNLETTITEVLPKSPAEAAGLKSGDIILSVNKRHLDSAAVSYLIAQSVSPLEFEIARGGGEFRKTISPQEGVVAGQRAIGVSIENIGTAKLPLLQALEEGMKLTWQVIKATLLGLSHVTISQVSGPVGLVKTVGNVATLGFSYLLSFVSIISINLALINLLPIPALDGGRILFVLIESITRRRIPTKVFNIVNNIGFALLIILMIFVTAHDVRGL